MPAKIAAEAHDPEALEQTVPQVAALDLTLLPEACVLVVVREVLPAALAALHVATVVAQEAAPVAVAAERAALQDQQEPIWRMLLAAQV